MPDSGAACTTKQAACRCCSTFALWSALRLAAVLSAAHHRLLCTSSMTPPTCLFSALRCVIPVSQSFAAQSPSPAGWLLACRNVDDFLQACCRATAAGLPAYKVQPLRPSFQIALAVCMCATSGCRALKCVCFLPFPEGLSSTAALFDQQQMLFCQLLLVSALCPVVCRVLASEG
jgi:hypothetical protein